MMWSPSDWFSYSVKPHPMSALQADYTKLQKSSCLHRTMLWNGSLGKCHCLGVMLCFFFSAYFYEHVFRGVYTTERGWQDILVCSLKLTLYSPSRGDNHYLALYSKMHNKPYLWIFKKRKGCAFIWKRRESMKKKSRKEC